MFQEQQEPHFLRQNAFEQERKPSEVDKGLTICIKILGVVEILFPFI